MRLLCSGVIMDASVHCLGTALILVSPLCEER